MTSRPPSVVSSSRFSGTRVTMSGPTSIAMAMISGVAAISRLSLVFKTSLRSRTSRSCIWRLSSRKCTTMPSAPACSHRTAASTGSGILMPRACLTVATWSTLTASLAIHAYLPLPDPLLDFDLAYEAVAASDSQGQELLPLLLIIGLYTIQNTSSSTFYGTCNLKVRP